MRAASVLPQALRRRPVAIVATIVGLGLLATAVFVAFTIMIRIRDKWATRQSFGCKTGAT